ncbi:hypothetical protein J5X84_29915 [Streptosporangiaceae bacterium NEAU-GS5]|nr:hypothetical protein [Streptosporangiaceae bacterium NEAU-GS5]
MWVVLSWLLFVVLLIVGIVGFAGGLVSTINDAAPSSTFTSGQTVNVALNPADKPAIYAAADKPTDVNCQAQGSAGEKVTLNHPSTSQTVSLGGDRWELLFTVGVPSAGTYQVTCEGDGVRFGVGKELIGNAGKLVGGAIALVALPAVGFLLALVVTIVVLVRRGSARKARAYGTYGPA